jgi:hypothetical protein
MKRRLLPLPIVFALLFAPLQMGSDTAYACSCGTLATVEERVRSADLVAIGTVTALYEERITFDSKSGEGELVDTDGVFAIDAYYKGTGPTEIPVDDPISGACGFLSSDSVGREAVLFLDLSDGEYVTHLCAGSNFISGDEDSRAEMIAGIEVVTGPGQTPDAPSQEEPADHTEDTPWAIILPLAFGIPLAVLVVPAFLRRGGGGH